MHNNNINNNTNYIFRLVLSMSSSVGTWEGSSSVVVIFVVVAVVAVVAVVGVVAVVVVVIVVVAI
jgi:hypothetical protein